MIRRPKPDLLEQWQAQQKAYRKQIETRGGLVTMVKEKAQQSDYYKPNQRRHFCRAFTESGDYVGGL